MVGVQVSVSIGDDDGVLLSGTGCISKYGNLHKNSQKIKDRGLYCPPQIPEDSSTKYWLIFQIGGSPEDFQTGQSWDSLLVITSGYYF